MRLDVLHLDVNARPRRLAVAREEEIGDREGVHDGEDRPFRPLEQVAVGGGVALDHGEAVLAAAGRVFAGARRPRPAAVLVERLALEVAGARIGEARLLRHGHVAAGERELERLERAGKAGVDGEVEPLPGKLAAESACLLLPARGQRDRRTGVAVEQAAQAVLRLAVPRQDQKISDR